MSNKKRYTLTFMKPNGEYTVLASYPEYKCDCEEEDVLDYCNHPRFDEPRFINGFDKKIRYLLNDFVWNKLVYRNENPFQLRLGEEPYLNFDKNQEKDCIVWNAPIPEEYRDVIRIDGKEEPKKKRGRSKKK